MRGSATGLVNNLSLICFVILIILSIFKIPAILSIIYTSIVGLIISIINNHYTLQEISGFLFGGFSKANLSQNIVSLLNRGGVFVTSVLGVPTLTYLPFSFFCYLL